MIRFILDEHEFSATCWLGKLNNDAVKELEEAVRMREPDEIIPNPKAFKFSAIQRMCLDSIAEVVREKGIFHFIQDEAAHPQPLRFTAPVFNADPAERERLVNKLVESFHP